MNNHILKMCKHNFTTPLLFGLLILSFVVVAQAKAGSPPTLNWTANSPIGAYSPAFFKVDKSGNSYVGKVGDPYNPGKVVVQEFSPAGKVIWDGSNIIPAITNPYPPGCFVDAPCTGLVNIDVDNNHDLYAFEVTAGYAFHGGGYPPFLFLSVLVKKYDSSGTLQWTSTYDLPSSYSGPAGPIEDLCYGYPAVRLDLGFVDGSGNVHIAGECDYTNGGTDPVTKDNKAWGVVYSSSGAQLGSAMQDIGTNYVTASTHDTLGNVYAGYLDPASDAFKMIKFGSSGAIANNTTLFTGNNVPHTKGYLDAGAESVYADNNGNLYFQYAVVNSCSYSRANGWKCTYTNYTDKHDPSGNLVWSKQGVSPNPITYIDNAGNYYSFDSANGSLSAYDPSLNLSWDLTGTGGESSAIGPSGSQFDFLSWPNGSPLSQYTFTAPPMITVTVTPPSASVQATLTQQFTASTTDSKGVTWSLSGSGCGSGPACGTVSPSASLTGVPVTYTAPVAVPSPAAVTITATSITDTTKSASAAITVAASAPPATGTINVSSINSVVPSVKVPATWDFTGMPLNGSGNFVDPCPSPSCAGVGGNYQNVPLGQYILGPLAATAPNYVLRSVERNTIVSAQNPVFAFLNSFISTAKAWTVCGIVNGSNPGSNCNNKANQQLALMLANPGDTANFSIDWAPVGTIDVNPTTMNLTNANQSAQVGLADTNGAPSSSVSNLSAIIQYKGSQTGWLSASSLSGVTLIQGANPTSVTLTASALNADCSSGCNATVTLQGTSVADGGTVTSAPITVSFTASNPNNNITVSIKPTSAKVQVNNSQNFTPTTNDPAGIIWTLSGSGCSGGGCGTISSNASLSGVPVTFTAPGDVPNPAGVTIKATSVTNDKKVATAAITVFAPLTTCNIQATPGSVIVPETTVLSYSCTNVPPNWPCSLTDQNDASYNVVPNVNGVVSSTDTVAPTVTMTYTIACGSGGGGASDKTVVTVTNPKIGECPPQGCTP